MLELTNPLNNAKRDCWRRSDDLSYGGWLNGIRLLVRFEGGVPAPIYRQRVWLILANRSIQRRRLDWPKVLAHCFSEHLTPDDVQVVDSQIVKDLHRTGCSTFGQHERHNQILLKQVLLAYARFNKGK